MRGSQNWPRWATKRSFAPWDVPETTAWFSPRHGITNVSGAVSSWAPLLTGSPSVSQSTAGFRPLIGTGINGNESLAFDAANFRRLRNTTDNLVAAGATRYVLAVVKSADATGGSILTFRLGTRSWALMSQDIGGNRFYFTDSVSVNANEVGAGPDFTIPTIIEWELTVGTKAVVRVNGVARTISGGNLVAENGTTGFDIGYRDTKYWTGDIGDVYIASGIPSAADLAKLYSYFRLVNGFALP